MDETRAVLLDVDGTLVDSNDAHARAWREALLEHGRRIDLARIRACIGMGGDKLLPELTGIDAESAEGKRIAERRGAIFRGTYLPSVRPFARARELLLRMKDDGWTLVAASSAEEEELDALLAVAGARDLVEGAISSDDADRSKPDPDIVQAALSRARASPEHAILLGDTPYDVAAANRADVAIVALRCGGWSAKALAGAVETYADPAELLDRYASSPFAAGTRGRITTRRAARS